MTKILPLVRGGGEGFEPVAPPKRSRPEGYSHPPSTGPDFLTFAWQGVEVLLGTPPSLEGEYAKFQTKWKSLGFVEKLEMILRLKEEVDLHDCQVTKAIKFFTPFLESPEIKVALSEMGLDSATLLGAVHQPNEPASAMFLGMFRNHLDLYLTHVLKEAKKLMVREDISPHRKAVEILKVFQTRPRAEDGELSEMQAFRECYEALPERDRALWREAYRAQGTVGGDGVVDWGLKRAAQDPFYLTILRPILEREGKEMDVAFLQALKEAQQRSGTKRAQDIVASLRDLRVSLLDRIIYKEQELYPALRRPPEGSFIEADPTCEVARKAVESLM